MDEKEEADRLAAAEALFMISNRGEKPQLPVRPRPTRRGKKQKLVDYDDITAVKRRTEDPIGEVPRHVPTNERGRGGRKGGTSTRGRVRGRGSGKKHASVGRKKSDEYESDDRNNMGSLTIDTEIHPNPDPLELEQEVTKAKPSRGRGKKRGGKSSTKSKAQVKTQRQQKSEPSASRRNSHAEYSGAIGTSKSGHSKAGSSDDTPGSQARSTSSSANLPSLGLVSGFKQVSLASRAQSNSDTAGLPSLNLSSLVEGNLPSVNLPSIPPELSFLQLSSQPTPNLSSLGDVAVSQAMDVDSQADREKFEKFLPLKKRKLHKTDESASTPTTVATDSPADGSSVSDSEERYEPISPEPTRPPFTVQAPPIITMQTLMEIKTALQADDDGDLPLHIAVVHENMRMVAKLVSLMKIAGKGVDKFNKQQQTPLHLAIKLDFTEAVELLLKFGADVNAVDCSGSSAIHMAVQGRSTLILRLLLEKCPNVQLNNRNIDGLTPLHTAVDNGDLEQVELLLQHGADIDITDGKSGRTGLFRAAESNHKPMVELLLRHGASVDVPSYAGVTVSMAAQGRNLHGVLKLLGSVQDKFPSGLEVLGAAGTGKSKPPLLYVGFSTPGNPPILTPALSGQIGLSGQPLLVKPSSSPPSSSPSSSSSATKQRVEDEGRELTYLVRQQSKLGRSDNTSGGVMLERADPTTVTAEQTKVFKNVFMLSDKNDSGKSKLESVSEPSSPEPKSSDGGGGGAWRREKGRRAGLLSLPETIDLSKDGDKPARKKGQSQLVSAQQRRVSTLEGSESVGAPKSPAGVVEGRGSKPAAVIKRVTVGSPKPAGSSPHRDGVAGNFVGRISSDGVLHLVPSSPSSVPSVPLSSQAVPSPSSRSPISLLALKASSSPSLGSPARPQASPTSSVLLPVLSSPTPSSPSSSPRHPALSASSPRPALSGEATPPPVTTSLTSIQAKLYETLLRRSYSRPSSPAVGSGPTFSPTTSSEATASAVVSSLAVSPLSSSSPSLHLSSPAGAMSYRVMSKAAVVPGLLAARRNAPGSIPLIRVPCMPQSAESVGSSLTSSPPSTPLNLSKPRARQASVEQAETNPTSSIVTPVTPAVGVIQVGSGVVASPGATQQQAAGRSTRKVISIGMRKISNGDKSSAPSSTAVSSSSPPSSTPPTFQTQYEMFLLPDKQGEGVSMAASTIARIMQQGKTIYSASTDAGTVTSAGIADQLQSLKQVQQQLKSSSSLSSTVSSTSSLSHNEQLKPLLGTGSSAFTAAPHTSGLSSEAVKAGGSPSIVLDPATVAVMSRGELIVPNFPHISKCVSPATALIVRDLLSRQNQLLQKPAATTSPTSPSSSSSTKSVPSLPQTSVSTTTTNPATHPPGRFVIPPHLAQNSIVGLSGAILSVVPGANAAHRSPDAHAHHREDKVNHKSSSSPSQKEHHLPRKHRGPRGGSKGSQRSGGHNSDVTSSSPGAGSATVSSSSEASVPNLSKLNTETEPKLKINSETDQKLKRFLDAKRLETLASVKGRGAGWSATADPGKEAEEETEDSPEDGGALIPVGIFSGNVQKVKLSRTRQSTPVVSTTSSPSPAAGATLPATVVTSPSTHLPSASQEPSSSSSHLTGTLLHTSSTATSKPSVPPFVPEAQGETATSARAAATILSQTAAETASATDGGVEVEDDDDDEEEPMEIDCADSASDTDNIAATSTSTAVSSEAYSLRPSVQIIVQSPTPPLPAESSESEVRTKDPPYTETGATV